MFVLVVCQNEASKKHAKYKRGMGRKWERMRCILNICSLSIAYWACTDNATYSMQIATDAATLFPLPQKNGKRP